VLPVEIGAHSHAALLAGVAGALALGTGVAVQPFAKRVEDTRPLMSGAIGLVAAAAGVGVGILALHHQSPALILVSAPLFGIGYGGCLIAGLRETERIAAPEELGATVSVFYALTYLGFATPYVVEVLNGPLGQQPALATLAAAAVLTLTASSTAKRAE
jgi:drug/metabolite transporter (DMT)-like permease